MPKTLTPANVFTANVIVPDFDDEMDDATAQLELTAQSLTNRTHNLNQRAGKVDADNTWAGANVFQGITEVHTTLFVDPDDAESSGIHIDRTAGSDYQAMISGRAGSASQDRVRIYSGSQGDSRGALFFTVNAQWLGSDTWTQPDATKPSCALIMRNGDVRVVGKAAGSANWTTWQQSTLSAFDSEMLSEVFRAARTYTTGNTNADRTNGYRYTTPLARVSCVPLGTLWGNTQLNANAHVRRGALSGESDQIWIPIRIPPYCTFGTMQVRFYQLQASQPDEFQLFRRTDVSGWSGIGSVETHGSYGLTVATLHPGAAQEVLDGEEWAYRWKVVSGDGAAIDNRIVGITLNWADVGPNNRVG